MMPIHWNNECIVCNPHRFYLELRQFMIPDTSDVARVNFKYSLFSQESGHSNAKV